MAVKTATGWEHKDSNGGCNCKDATIGGATTAHGWDTCLPAGGGSGGNAACPTAGDGMPGGQTRLRQQRRDESTQ